MVNVQVSIQQQEPLFFELATKLFRTEPWEECRKERNKRLKCDCFKCRPLTLTEACIRHLAGESVDGWQFLKD